MLQSQLRDYLMAPPAADTSSGRTSSGNTNSSCTSRWGFGLISKQQMIKYETRRAMVSNILS